MSPRGGSLLPSATTGAPLDAAHAAARRAAERAAVRIAIPHGLADLGFAAEVWQRVWTPDGEPPVSGEMLRALTHAGNYLSMAVLDGEVVGALLGFFGSNGRIDHMHSHILGVDPHVHGRGVGFALKLHQRAWALERGIERMTWTYDPLVRRNGHFNLVKLGGRGVEYLVDFYGPMPDAINGGDHTDRILVDWDLSATALHDPAPAEEVEAWLARGAVVALDADPDGRPVQRDATAHADVLLCATPPDVVALRAEDAPGAQRWRVALREVMLDALSRGLRLTSMARGGWYVLARDVG